VNIRKLAAACIAVLFVYYEIYRWLPLGRWNAQYSFPVNNDAFYVDIVIGILLLWFAWSSVFGQRIGMWTAAALLYAWVVLDFVSWWVPYARSSFYQDNLAQAYAYTYHAAHTQILPIIGHHFPPGAGQVILDLILFPTTLIVTMAAVRQSALKD
jgi:hypothetical protein